MSSDSRVEPRIGIVGGGITGIVATLFLREKLGSKNLIAIERYPEFGGTWFENSYPGLSCDIPAHLYSFSFALNPNWSVPYPGRDELLKYIVDVADRFDVRKHYRMNCVATRGVWDDEKGVWKVYYKDLSKLPPVTKEQKNADGLDLPEWAVLSDPLSVYSAQLEALQEDSFECEFLYNTQKTTGAPGMPEIPGAKEKTFKGLTWHSMRWPTNGLELVKGKKVALIGCAAAAVQLVPQLQPLASHLSVFHRTPNHVMHRPNATFSEEQKKLWRTHPEELRKFRAEYEEKFFKLWINAACVDGSDEQQVFLAESKANLYDNIKDERLRNILWPDYRPWGRRVTFHDEFYPSLVKPNVEVVQDRIVRINEKGILTAAQNARDLVPNPTAPETQRDFDIIIYGTGWAAEGNKRGMTPFTGRNGADFGASAMNIKITPNSNGPPTVDLSQLGHWNYFGEMFEGFPNFFAPVSPTGFAIVRHAISQNLKSIEPSREAIEWWIKGLDERVKGRPPDKSYTTRLWFPTVNSPREFEKMLLYPIYSHFIQTPRDAGKPKWIVPSPPEVSMLDIAHPHLPDVEGIETFKGKEFHTTRWDYSYTGGNCKKLYVFQRTPSAVDVRDNTPTDPEWWKSLEPNWQAKRDWAFQLGGAGGDPDIELDDGFTRSFRGWFELAKHQAKTGEHPELSPAELMQLADFRWMNRIRKRCEDIVQDKKTAEALKPWCTF
ncbi:hypothetical protein HDU93_008996 [Gonapodya sp. JEL0774]|nr:hypothetical protein HDU93_008996 [Gonapodya sp. JEL0774]